MRAQMNIGSLIPIMHVNIEDVETIFFRMSVEKAFPSFQTFPIFPRCCPGSADSICVSVAKTFLTKVFVTSKSFDVPEMKAVDVNKYRC